MSEPRKTTMNVSPETLNTFRELSEKTKIPLFQIMEELAQQYAIIMKKMESSDRLIYMATAVPTKNYILLNFGLMFCSKDEPEDEETKRLIA
jgi:chromosomal replication initiation ATPase DnaA